MAEGPVAKALFVLSAPAITGMVVIALYNIADTFFVSLLRDTTAVAATGIVFPIFQLIGAIGLTFGIGAASVISRRLGEKDFQAANETAATALYSAIGAGVLFSIGGIIFIRPILTLFGATESILETAALYGRIIIGGSVFQAVNMCMNNILRSEGASVHSGTGQILGSVLNIILDPVFIFVFNMGITGAAAATVISQSICSAYLLGFYFRHKGVLHPLSVSNLRFDLHTYGQIMTLGLPTLIRQVLGSISFAIVNNAAGIYGNDSAIAAISITFRFFMLFLMALIGLAQGLQPLAGYNYGAKNFKRVKQTLKLVLGITFSVCLSAGIIIFIFSNQIIFIFAPQDPAVIRMGTIAMRFMAAALVPVGFAILFGGIFQSLGDGRSALILAAGQQGIFLIPMVLLLPKLFGLTGVFAAQPAGFTMAFLIGAILFVKLIYRLRNEEHHVKVKNHN